MYIDHLQIVEHLLSIFTCASRACHGRCRMSMLVPDYLGTIGSNDERISRLVGCKSEQYCHTVAAPHVT